MDIVGILIGVAVMAGGIFVASYGNTLFRFALAVLGFMVGFSVANALTGSLDPATSMFIALAVGAITAAVAFALVRIGKYIAGALLGIVISMLVLSLLNIQSGDLLNPIGLVAGLAIGGFAGRFFGDMIILSSTSFVGAYGIMLGMARLFPELFRGEIVGGRLPVTLPLLVMMIAIALVGGLAQYQIYRLRRRGVLR